MARRGTRALPREKARRILVSMGGADPGNVTTRVLDAIAGLGLEIRAVVGAANPHLAEVRAAAAMAGAEICVQVGDMRELMTWADLAITAGGSTCWEMCLIGLPMVAICIAENQRGIVRGLGAAGAALDAGDSGSFDAGRLADIVSATVVDQSLRRNLSLVARRLVDGRGADRVVAAMRSFPAFTSAAP